MEQRCLLAGGPVVEFVTPPANWPILQSNLHIEVEYDQYIDVDSVSNATFAVHAMQSGKLLSTSEEYDLDGDQVRLSPATDFKPGELVQVTVTKEIQSQNGIGAEAAYVWQYRAEVTPSNAVFQQSGQDYGIVAMRSLAVGLVDLDGDSDLDALVANDGPNRVWLNDGQGRFTDSGQRLGGSESHDVALGGLDGDGDLDAFVGTWNEPDTIWLNDGNGGFGDSGQLLGHSTPHAVALGDLDGDGDLDAYVGNKVGDPSMVWLNDGHGEFGDSGQRLGNLRCSAVVLADMDGDGDLDALTTNYGQDPNMLWLNDGNGTFSNSGQKLGSSYSLAVALGDVDNDGDLDALVANRNANKLWLNDATGQLTDSGQRLGNTRSSAVDLGDLDGGTYQFVLEYKGVSFEFDVPNHAGTDYLDLSFLEPVVVRAPNVYLYPEVGTEIDVTVGFPSGGCITESEPAYSDGWHVQVAPDGTIEETYDYLFYKASIPQQLNADQGWVLDGADLEGELRRLLTRLGFAGREVDDFVAHWVPELQGSSWYAVYPQDVESLISLDISPAPDHVLRTLLLLRPLDRKLTIPAPSDPGPFLRDGFVVAEWGVLYDADQANTTRQSSRDATRAAAAVDKLLAVCLMYPDLFP